MLRGFEGVEARGHDPRLVACWEPERRWLFSGDAVLPIPTPLTPVVWAGLAMVLLELQPDDVAPFVYFQF